jgi:hypothetical protein
MQVRLKILHGSKAGKEVKIPAPKCLIGRGEDCHLRPSIDAVSRRHCEIITSENEVMVRDLKSRNGTFVNGERVTGEAVLLSGDLLGVGPLEFEMLIDQSPAKAKRPKVADIKEAVARTAEGSESSSSTDLGDVSEWLEEADTEEKQRRTIDPDTRQFRLDETAPAEGQKKDTATVETKALPSESKKEQKKSPGKLPPRPAKQTKDSQEAAAGMLKKFFNRR